MPRIRVHPRMPHQRNRSSPQFKRRRKQTNRQHIRKNSRNAPGRRQNQIRSRNNMRRDQKMRHHYRNTPLQTKLRQRPIHHTAIVPVLRNQNMRQLRVLLQRQNFPHLRIPQPHHALQLQLKQISPIQRLRNTFRTPKRQHKIKLSRLQPRRPRMPPQLPNTYIDPRRKLAQTLQKTRQNHKLRIIISPDHKCLLTLSRHKFPRWMKQTLHLTQRFSQRLKQFLPARRQHHPATRPHQQRIPKLFAQPFQRMTHRRLAQPNHLRSPRYTAFLEQGLQRHQKIQIDRRYIHHINNLYMIYAFV